MYVPDKQPLKSEIVTHLRLCQFEEGGISYKIQAIQEKTFGIN